MYNLQMCIYGHFRESVFDYKEFVKPILKLYSEFLKYNAFNLCSTNLDIFLKIEAW